MTTTSEQTLFPGEEISFYEGYPVLKYFQPSDTDKPLVVFATAAVLGRASYQVGSAAPDDFIAHWFKQAGHPFLALTYPMQHPVFSQVFPRFTIQDWGQLFYQAIEDTITTQLRTRSIILLCWGVGSRVIYRLMSQILKQQALTPELIVSISGTPGMPYSSVSFQQHLSMSPNGLSNISKTLIPYLDYCLDEQNKLNEHTIVSQQEYAQDLYAAVPVAIWGTKLRYEDRSFSENYAALIDDLGITSLKGYPFFAHIRPASQLHNFNLMNHAISDNGAWRMMMNLHAHENYVAPQADQIKQMSEHEWLALLGEIENIYQQLSQDVDGNIMCIMGNKTAKQVVDAVLQSHQKAQQIKQRLHDLLAISP